MAPMFMYLAWTLPLGAMLVRELFAKPARARKLVPAFGVALASAPNAQV